MLKQFFIKERWERAIGLFVLSIYVSFSSMAQSATLDGDAGVAAIEDAQVQIKKYFAPVTIIIYIIAAIVGMIGAFKVYNKWQNGDQDVQKVAVGWFGSFLFLIIANTVLRSVFGIN
ncbi:uncharacterized protein DUF4134 [Arcicella aurantiaca]|uniref:Uncharacterized protein DUF4134 n=1 Tax=Arcicella aurantiaca TaxID=591202 RepID=A0A316DHU3_9BACT|nr:DUF4134 domain-containing protein [Arcicella aurantiaca]PWK16799.1 uncharacterized protein DUF4134 [Arcicella aurantiaca]